MRKSGFMKGMAKSVARKANKKTTEAIYQAMWGEPAPKRKTPKIGK